MGRGDPKARARRHRRTIPALKPVERREVDGSTTRRKREVRDEVGADIPMLDARARQLGRRIKPERTKGGRPNRDNISANKRVRSEMRSQAYEGAAGQAICIALNGGERERVLRALRGLQAAEERYHRIVLGLSMHAKCARVEMAPERVETSANHAPPDLRIEEDRVRAATNEWMRWKGYTMHLPSERRAAIFNATSDRVELHHEGVLTPHGRRFVKAIRELADVAEG